MKRLVALVVPLLLVVSFAGCVEEPAPMSTRPDKRPLQERFGLGPGEGFSYFVDGSPPYREFVLRDDTNYCGNCDDDDPPAREWVVEAVGLGEIARATGVDAVEFPFEHVTTYTVHLHLEQDGSKATYEWPFVSVWEDRTQVEVPAGPAAETELWKFRAPPASQELRIVSFVGEPLTGGAGNGRFVLTGPAGWEAELSPTMRAGHREWEGLLPGPGEYLVTWRPSVPLTSGLWVQLTAGMWPGA